MNEQELINIAMEFATKRNEIETSIFEKAELDRSIDYFPEYEKDNASKICIKWKT